jgi:cobalamin biosynthesis protein CobD/CbiB
VTNRSFNIFCAGLSTLGEKRSSNYEGLGFFSMRANKILKYIGLMVIYQLICVIPAFLTLFPGNRSSYSMRMRTHASLTQSGEELR